MKRISFILIVFSLFFSSCDVGEPGLDGEAYVKINWNYEEPSYVRASKLLPWKFVYDTYYRASPGEYIVEFGYKYVKQDETVVYPYTVSVEIWVEEGEYGGPHGRDGRDASHDVLFDIELYPDGDIDFLHELVKRDPFSTPKSYTVESEGSNGILVSQSIERKGCYAMKYSVYRHPAYVE